ncbi:unnamed protein product (macronuclear) [Paramecium tetraurelia]|uniref:protein-tyrosine-phosphatase n=1 Tax=Paramecium tetraurelia TaxID=5888 RepID=A0DCI5_PARTE|nr:uncharacterized protein GSPATT00015630001 [Paramecium tetraurelia]CAK80752.1 unnamed protein product [Paramecium tetraurelia]|eukprot:XP_001448149.1 hypothetical protein (macronuclear) [Paramecium tetraurelia strain d4-2]
MQKKHCDLILNEKGSLWLGNCESALDVVQLCVIQEFLKLKGIKTVITVAAGLQLKLNGLVHHIIEIFDSDTANISQHFQTANEWIERGFKIGGVSQVHCMAGISRSAAIVISYLIEKKKMNYNQALSFVKSKRPQINPNKGFSNQLQAFVVKVQQSPLARNTRGNNFQQNQEYYDCNYYAPINRKGSAGILQQNMNFYKSITKSISQSKNKNK